MTEAKFAAFVEQLRYFDTAHVVTRGDEDELVGRPMAIAGVTEDGHLWFITHADSSAVSHITEHPQVAACLQAGGRNLCVSGLARTSRDPDRIERLWDVSQTVWFEKGRQDPDVILLEIVPLHGEYWDRSGLRGIDFRLRVVGALVSGRQPVQSGGMHGTVDFEDRSD